MADIQKGTAAPDFALKNQDGKIVRLSDYRGKQHVVVFFYPKDFSPVCTFEVCAFRDSYDAFVKAGAAVFGISSDNEKSHSGFAQKHGLRFELLSDSDGSVRKLYGAVSFGILPGRVTYVIDKNGIVIHLFSSQLSAEGHVKEAIKALEEAKEG